MELCASVEPLLGSYPGPNLALSGDSCGLQIESVCPRSRVAKCEIKLYVQTCGLRLSQFDK